MPPSSKLAIAASSVKRLIKEEASYHKEVTQQEARIKKLEAGNDDENAEYQLKQEVLTIHYRHSVHAWADKL
jgi:tubulin-specific chaperone A